MFNRLSTFHSGQLRVLSSYILNIKVEYHFTASLLSPLIRILTPMKTRNIMALNLALSCLVACNSPAADGPFVEQKQVLANKVKSELVKLEGGSFEMGDWGVNGGYYDMDSDSNPLHKVTLNTFYLNTRPEDCI